MSELSPINYSIHVCHSFIVKPVLSMCTTGFLFLLGDDHTAISIALMMLTLDTITGNVAAWRQKKWNAEMNWRFVHKLIAVGSAFVVGNLFALFEPTIGSVLKYMVASAIIYAEGGSVLKNGAKIDPTYDFKKVLDKIRKV